MSNPKFEALITVPTGGWVATIASVARTVPATTYYLSSPDGGTYGLLDKLENLESGLTATVSATTGLVTLSKSGTFTVVWTSTDLRDALGFTGDLSGSASYTGTNQPPTLWLPKAGAFGLKLTINALGLKRTDRVIQEARSGQLASTKRNSYTDERFSFTGLAKTVVAEEDDSPTNASLESFWETYLEENVTIRYYTSASDDSTYQTPGAHKRDYKFVGKLDPKRMRGQYEGLWMVDLDFRVSV